MRNDIAIIIGRKIVDNINREIVLYNLLNLNNLSTCFLIPGNKISHASLSTEDIKNFHKTNYKYFNSIEDFKRISNDFDFFLIASWRDYFPLVSYLKSQNKKILVYSDAGGIDFWDMGANLLMLKSMANLLVYQNGGRNLIKNFYKKYFKKKIITGSVRYEYCNNNYKKILNIKKKKLIVFFPKCFSNIRSKIEDWFPFKSKMWYDSYLINLKNHYKKISNEINKNNNYYFCVKLHYGYYDLKFSKKNDSSDRKFWNDIGVKIFTGDERELFKKMDVGVGVESHSSIDVNYHNKPFIYVKPFNGSKPKQRGFDLGNLFNFKKIKIPSFQDSSKCTINVKDCWLPYWYGAMTDISNLNSCIEKVLDQKKDLNYLKQVQEFYWGHSNQNKTSERILEIVKSYI